MINVDLETLNRTSEGDCRSQLHEAHNIHADLTIHRNGASCRNSRAVRGRETRFWDDNGGVGYTLAEVAERIHELQAQHSNAFPRRCLRCGVDAHLPDWD
jgi:hypothetical protein